MLEGQLSQSSQSCRSLTTGLPRWKKILRSGLGSSLTPSRQICGKTPTATGAPKQAAAPGSRRLKGAQMRDFPASGSGKFRIKKQVVRLRLTSFLAASDLVEIRPRRLDRGQFPSQGEKRNLRSKAMLHTGKRPPKGPSRIDPRETDVRK